MVLFILKLLALVRIFVMYIFLIEKVHYRDKHDHVRHKPSSIQNVRRWVSLVINSLTANVSNGVTTFEELVFLNPFKGVWMISPHSQRSLTL